MSESEDMNEERQDPECYSCSSCNSLLDKYTSVEKEAPQCNGCERYMCPNEKCSHEINQETFCVFCPHSRVKTIMLSVVSKQDTLMVSKSRISFFLSRDEAKTLIIELQNFVNSGI